MFIYPADLNNMVSYIHGYESGRNKKCNLTQAIRELAEKKYSIDHRNTGWPGQVSRLAKKKKTEAATLLRQMILEVLMQEKLNKTATSLLKRYILIQTERIHNKDILHREHGHTEFLIHINKQNDYLRKIWNKQEWEIVRKAHKIAMGLSPRPPIH